MTEYFNLASEKNKRRQLRNSMPKAEVILWSRLKCRQLLGHKFRRQYSVGPFILDFYCPDLHLALEIDGDSHFEDGAQEYDADRQKYIGSFGIKVMRFLNTEIYENIDMVLEAIARELEVRRGARSNPP